jgi:signal transduction histidine kinase
MTLPHAILLLINGLALSASTGLIFVMLILPRRGAANRWFALFLAALGLWAYFAMARVIPDMSPFNETENFYILFMGLAAAPVAFYGFAVTLTNPRDGFAPLLLLWGIGLVGVMIALLWADQVLTYQETGADRVNYSLKTAGLILAVHLGLYLLLSLLYLHSTPSQQVRVLRLPALLITMGYAKNLIPALRLPPLSIGLLSAAAFIVGYYLLRWQLFNPLREVQDELRVANSDLRKALADATKERDQARELRRELADATRYKSEFLSGVGLQLRTPLSSLVGYSELLLSGTYGDLNDKQRDRMEKISRNSHNLLALINDVIDLSKIEGGRMELSLSPVRLDALAEMVLTQFAGRAAEKGLALHKEIETPLPRLRGDEERIAQVMRSLLENAIQFTAAGEVQLSVKQVMVKDGQSQALKLPFTGWLEDRTWLLLSVSDTGIGIPPEDQAAIFDEFHLASSEQGQQYEGPGLGLTVAKKLVELHNGRIWVQSQVDQGSTFYVALPVVEG